MTAPLIKKLRLHTVENALVLNAPEGFFGVLGDIPETLILSEKALGETKFAYVQVFVKDSIEYQQWVPKAIEASGYDGLLWICYPKKSAKIKSDLSRDIIWEMTKGTGIRPVTQVSIDETWSALRFRPDDAVGK